MGAHDHPIKPPGPHREGLRHLWWRRHHHRCCAADRVDPRQPPQRPPRLGRPRLPSPRRDGPAALQPAATGRCASKPQRSRPGRELTCHRECPPKRCCAFPTCLSASASADARCVDGAPTAHSPKPSGWARTPSAGPATSSTNGSPTGPLRALDAPSSSHQRPSSGAESPSVHRCGLKSPAPPGQRHRIPQVVPLVWPLGVRCPRYRCGRS